MRLTSLFRGHRMEREMDEELRFHLENKIEEGVANGLSPVAARHAAMRAMQGLEQKKEEIRDTRRIHGLTDFVDDARYAMRSLRRTPGLSVFIVITLALGIGLSAATFSMVDALIFRPYPVRDPGGIVSLLSTSQDNSYGSFSYSEFQDIRDQTTSYDGVIANGITRAVGFSAEPGGTPRVKGGTLVSANYFQVLGVEPTLGRGFRADEDQPGNGAAAVLGSYFWKQEFGGDPSVLGRHIRLNGTEFTVIGVAPESFPGMDIFGRPDFYMPLGMARVFSSNPQKNFFEDRDDRELRVKARLKRTATLQQARNELALLAQNFERAYPQFNRNRGAGVRTQFDMRTRDDDINWKFSVIFATLALAVLLVACTNVAGLLLSRARTRTREIAIRLAIGAGRFRLIRMLLAESLMLACLGGVAGVGVGNLGIEFFRTFKIPTELAVPIPFQMDMRVLLASLALSILSAAACGLAPALQSTRTDPVNGLKSGDVEVPGRKRLWGRNALVVAQVATSLMLLAASFLMVRGFHSSVDGQPGFAKDHLLMARFDPRLVQYTAAQTKQFYKLLTDRMRTAPGVQSVGLTLDPPLGLDDYGRVAFVPEGFQLPSDRENLSSTMDTVDEGYFSTMGIPILRGRGFQASDTADSPRVAVVNEQFTKHYWPGADAVGKRIRLDNAGGTPVEIAGVAKTIAYRDPTERPMDFVYMPVTQHPMARMVLLMRSSGDPLQLAGSLKQVLRTLDSNMPISELRTYEDLYRYNTVEGPRIAIEMVGTMGMVGLLLAIAGLYGLVAYNVSQRTREIGIRMAIGATPADALRLVMGKGLVLVAVGTVIGLAMGFGVEQLMNSMLFNAGGVDILAYAVVAPSMFLATVVAAWGPARRASQIAATEALRYE